MKKSGLQIAAENSEKPVAMCPELFYYWESDSPMELGERHWCYCCECVDGPHYCKSVDCHAMKWKKWEEENLGCLE